MGARFVFAFFPERGFVRFGFWPSKSVKQLNTSTRMSTVLWYNNKNIKTKPNCTQQQELNVVSFRRDTTEYPTKLCLKGI